MFIIEIGLPLMSLCLFSKIAGQKLAFNLCLLLSVQKL